MVDKGIRKEHPLGFWNDFSIIDPDVNFNASVIGGNPEVLIWVVLVDWIWVEVSGRFTLY
jgi:hypothetical protein